MIAMPNKESLPLHSLIVRYHDSEGRIFDAKNEPFPRPELGESAVVFKREQAYEFLVGMNRADKQAGRKQHLRAGGYDKSWISLAYQGKILLNQERIDLGDLRFGNATNLAEGLDHLMTQSLQYALNHEKVFNHWLEYQRREALTQEPDEQGLYKYCLDNRPVSPGAQPKDFAHFDENDPDGRYGAIYYKRPLTPEELLDFELRPASTEKSDMNALTPKAYRKELVQEIQTIHEITKTFRKEEQKLLAHRPDLDAINQEKCPLFYYACPKSFLTAAKRDIGVLEVHPPEDFPNSTIFSMNSIYFQTDLYHFIQEQQGIPFDTDNKPETCIIGCHRSPESLMESSDSDVKHLAKKLSLIIPEEDALNLQALQGLTIDTHSTSGPSHAYDALLCFEKLLSIDTEELFDTLNNRCYIPEEEKRVTLLYEGEPLYDKIYRPGAGDLAREAPKYLPPIDDLFLRASLGTAYDTACTYQDRLRSRWSSYAVLDEFSRNASLPDPATSIKNLPQVYQKPAMEKIRARNYDAIHATQNYYLALGKIKTGNPDREAVYEAAVKAMIADGYDIRKIKLVTKDPLAPGWMETAAEMLKQPAIKKQMKAVSAAKSER